MANKIKDTDYLAISARVRAMETTLLTAERMERLLEARSDEEVSKLLQDCGYPELDAARPEAMDAALSQAREELLTDLGDGAPDPRYIDIFKLKYDYHNAKAILKAAAMGTSPDRMLMDMGRIGAAELKTAVESGELDANFFQHRPYLENFNEENDTHLVSVAVVHYEPFGLYPGKTTSLENLKDNAQIAIPNDGTNEARALLLLESLGLITLKDGVGTTATILDIAENPKNLQITEMAAAQLARSLQDVDMAVINGNYALQAGLDLNDALATEDKNSEVADTYANVLVVKEGNENSDAIKALSEVLTSPEIKTFIDETYHGIFLPLF